MQTKITAKFRAKSLAEPCLLLSVGGYLFRSITCQVSKLTAVCIHGQSALGEVAEFFALTIYETLRDVMLTESLTEFSPSSDLADWAHSFKIFPPKASRTFEMIGNISNLVGFGYVGRT